VTLAGCLTLSSALFCLGLYGLLTRRHAVGILLSIEIMANAANLNFVAFSRFSGSNYGQVFALFVLGLTVAEVAVGLSLVLLLFRSHKDALVDLAHDLRH